jgi:hypothetical protein
MLTGSSYYFLFLHCFLKMRLNSMVQWSLGGRCVMMDVRREVVLYGIDGRNDKVYADSYPEDCSAV